MLPVSNAPLVAVAVWPTASEFVQVTRSPTLIVIDAGENAKSEIATARVAARATVPPTTRAAAAATQAAMSDRDRGRVS